MLKRFIVFLLIAIFSIGIFATTTINVWFSWEGQKEFQTLVDQFNTSQSLYHVNLVYIPSMTQKLQITLSSGNQLPDLALIQSGYDMGFLVNANVLTPVGTVNTSKAFYNSFLTNGKLYAYPYYADVQVIYLNRKIYKGPLPSDNWNLSDFETLANKIKEDGHIGAVLNNTSSYFFNSFYAAFNEGVIPQENGIPIVNNNGTIKAAEFYNKIFNVDKIAVSFTKAALINSFTSGKTGMLFQGSFLIPDFLNLGLDFTILPYPYFDNGQPIQPDFDAKGFAIFKNSEAVRAFLDYITSAKNEVYFCASTYKLPANLEAMHELDNSNQFFRIMDLSGQKGLILPTTNVFQTAYSDAISTALQLYLSGQMSVDEALSKAQNYIDSQAK
jgi:ABC-type glycerol-3-phosphate transport system substrate-binding protein